MELRETENEGDDDRGLEREKEKGDDGTRKGEAVALRLRMEELAISWFWVLGRFDVISLSLRKPK